MHTINISFSVWTMFKMLAFYIPQILIAQDKPFNCSSVKSGTFTSIRKIQQRVIKSSAMKIMKSIIV